jgi:hypothetical protein
MIVGTKLADTTKSPLTIVELTTVSNWTGWVSLTLVLILRLLIRKLLGTISKNFKIGNVDQNGDKDIETSDKDVETSDRHNSNVETGDANIEEGDQDPQIICIEKITRHCVAAIARYEGKEFMWYIRWEDFKTKLGAKRAVYKSGQFFLLRLWNRTIAGNGGEEVSSFRAN